MFACIQNCLAEVTAKVMENNDALQRLLDRMGAGDDDAAQAVYDEYAPFLRMVIRRKLTSELRARFDSSDVVQSVWADLLDGFRKGRWSFDSPNHLRAFLVRATHNRFIDYVRKHGPSTNQQASWDEETIAQDAAQPSAEARANEKWHEILQRCTPEQRPIVEMKREGYSLAEIAEKTGYHPSSIRRILYTLSDQTDN